MARVRGGGSTGSAVALVIFGCGFVIALLVAIILYTKIETHKNAEQAAKDDLAKYVGASEMAAASEFLSGESTAFAALRQRDEAKQATIDKLEKDNAELERANTAMDAGLRTARSQVESLQAELAAESAGYAQQMQTRSDQVDALIREKDTLQARVAALSQKVNQDISSAALSSDQRITSLSQEVTDAGSELLAAQRERDEWQEKYEDLLASLPELPEPNTTRPDGQVASVFGGGRDLFITLGRSDGLVVGMTFEVFDPNPVIRLSTQGEARGKATIEVYNLEDKTATCRIVRMDRGEQIDPGDPIVNLAYDPNMTIKMYAFGYFDIEGDGGSSDLNRVNALIRQYGAEIPELAVNEDGIPTLTPDLDYVILGEKPELPDKPGADEFDPEVIAEYQRKLALNEAYFRIVDEAKVLRIPVLNLRRFLDLTGYYVR